MLNKRPHLPVMQEEMLSFFKDQELKTCFEGTVGAGGHAALILETHPEIKIYLACDRDPNALELAEEKLKPWKSKIRFIRSNFSDLDLVLEEEEIERVDGFFLI